MVAVAVAITAVGATVFLYWRGPPPEEAVDTSSIEYEYWDFFNVSYSDFWDLRANQYTEWPINAECFNATAIAESVCTPNNPDVPDLPDYPYAHYYSAVDPTDYPNEANGSIWAPYRMRVSGFNVSGYSLSEPVFLPILNDAEQPGSRLEFSWYMQYLNRSRAVVIGIDCGTNFDYGTVDGYILESQIVLSMDLQESKRIFGVVASNPAEAVAWWADENNTDPGCLRQRGIERDIDDWFVAMGGGQTTTGKYDIATGYEWYYQPFRTNVSATVDPVTGVTSARIDHFAYGTEVLLARMFYWGNTAYRDHYLDSTRRAGWWGMENAWFEDFKFAGSLDSNSMDFTIRTVVQYTLQHVCEPGPNGIFDRVDDVPIWRWGPLLDDYVEYWGSRHLISELDRYTDKAYVLCTPGLPVGSYGRSSSYDYTPITWNPKRNETWIFRFPTGNIVFYDPNLTPFSANPLLAQFEARVAPMQLSQVKPAGFGTWDPATMTWTVRGPASTGGPDGSSGPDGQAGTADDRYPLEPVPLIEFRPGTTDGAPPMPAGTPSGPPDMALASTESSAVAVREARSAGRPRS